MLYNTFIKIDYKQVDWKRKANRVGHHKVQDISSLDFFYYRFKWILSSTQRRFMTFTIFGEGGGGYHNYYIWHSDENLRNICWRNAILKYTKYQYKLKIWHLMLSICLSNIFVVINQITSETLKLFNRHPVLSWQKLNQILIFWNNTYFVIPNSYSKKWATADKTQLMR